MSNHHLQDTSTSQTWFPPLFLSGCVCVCCVCVCSLSLYPPFLICSTLSRTLMMRDAATDYNSSISTSINSDRPEKSELIDGLDS